MTVKIERIDQAQDNQSVSTIAPEVKRPQTSTLSLEERLKVISNLIVDRIIEDQLNGSLRFKNKQTK